MKPKLLTAIIMLTIFFSCKKETAVKYEAPLFSLKELYEHTLYDDINNLPKNLDSVYRLDLSNQKLTQVPAIVSRLKNLQELNLSENWISELSSIENLHNLQILNIGANNFETFPMEIINFKKLKVLQLWWTDIKTFPDEFFTSNTAIEELDMTSMTEFDFTNNLNKIHLFKQLRRLNIGNNPIPNLNIQFDKMSNLEELGYIRQEKIDLKALCLRLANCENLKTIHLSDNKIKSLPKEIVLLKNLEELNLFQNKVKILPAYIVKMQKLKKITLIDNPVDETKIKEIENLLPNTTIIY